MDGLFFFGKQRFIDKTLEKDKKIREAHDTPL